MRLALHCKAPMLLMLVLDQSSCDGTFQGTATALQLYGLWQSASLGQGPAPTDDAGEASVPIH